MHDLELATIIFTLRIWRYYLLDSIEKIYTNHTNDKYVFTEEFNMNKGSGSN